MKKLLLGIAVATLVAGGAFARGPVGTVIVPFEFDVPAFYIPCLGEDVGGYVFGEARYHEFETPSGVFHVLDQWTFTSYRYGLTSGTVWLGYQTSPFQLNTKLDKGEVQQWVSRGRFVPLEGNAPAYVGADTFKITVNAQGELVVLREETTDGEDMHCVGPSK
jgi:hypothetical protein